MIIVFRCLLFNKVLLFITVLFLCITLSFSQNTNSYIRFVDSADIHIDESSEKVLAFLDSIPKPVEENIEGRVADYYTIMSLINDDFGEFTKLNNNLILALKYAEKENNCMVAGKVCLELFSNLHYIENDSLAYKYLEQASQHYESCDYEYGLFEIEQAHAYKEFLDRNHKRCNDLILSNLDKYRKADDAYYYLFAIYMLTCDYLYLNDFENAYKYFNEFKLLKANTSFTKYNYSSFEGSINMRMADVYYEKKELDSTFYYLNKSSGLLNYMASKVAVNYYETSSNAHKFIGNIDESRRYLDSLVSFQDSMYKKTVNTSFQINDSLIKAESDLKRKEKRMFSIKVLILVIILILVLTSMLYLLSYRKDKLNIEKASNETRNLSFLKSNNEKLAAKVQGLEDYINNLKKEIKDISALDESCQRNKIKEFYSNLHHNSNTLLDKSENHVQLVNDLNIDFFKQLQEKYPELNKSEITICYYLFIGFNNKEIAVFLNSTVRAIESKRYRVTKKIGLKNTILTDYLKETF